MSGRLPLVMLLVNLLDHFFTLHEDILYKQYMKLTLYDVALCTSGTNRIGLRQ